jgi:SagB-type dehydrogenase family enzyme
MKNPIIDRLLLKANLWDLWDRLETDQKNGQPNPPLQVPPPEGAPLIDLPSLEEIDHGDMPLREAIRRRQSYRAYNQQPLSLPELSFLLWATQGVRAVVQGGAVVRRTIPSAGSRHPFETYLLVQRVQGLQMGIYRYLSLEHQLCLLRIDPDLPAHSSSACANFAGEAAVVFAWTALPYRTEWRYGAIAPKLISLDAGHLCQNLYLAVTAIGAGTCAVAAYHQDEMDALLGVDQLDEFTIYCAPVGKVD